MPDAAKSNLELEQVESNYPGEKGLNSLELFTEVFCRIKIRIYYS
jgi:hypothetical protein